MLTVRAMSFAESTIITRQVDIIGIDGARTNIIGIDVKPSTVRVAENTEFRTTRGEHIKHILVGAPILIGLVCSRPCSRSLIVSVVCCALCSGRVCIRRACQRVGGVGGEILVRHGSPVDRASGGQRHLTVYGNGTTGINSKGRSDTVGNGKPVDAQVFRLESLIVHHAVARSVKEVRGLNHALEVSVHTDQRTAEGAFRRSQSTRKGASACGQVAFFVNGEVSVSNVDGAFLHRQLAGLEVQREVSAVIFQRTCADHIGIEDAGRDVVRHDRTVHCNGKPKGLSIILGVAKTVHVPFPELVGFGIVADIGNIKRVRTVFVPCDRDVAGRGRCHDLCGVFFCLF